jgi:2-dehydropantoate 2-reductase
VSYVVLGCGAIGGTVAAGLVRDGHDVLVSDADPAVVAAINASGLRIEGPVESFTVAVPALAPSGLPPMLDCPVLVAVKAQHTAAAAAVLAGRLHGDGYVVSLQNGLNAEILADAVGPERVVEACVNFGADVLEPGVVLRGKRATFVVGELDGRRTDRVRSLAADIADAQVTEHVLGYLWAKEAYGAMLAVTGVSDLPIADVLGDLRYQPLLLEVARQVLAEAPVPPVPFDGFDPADLYGSLARLEQFNRRSAKTHSGIYRDLAVRHRPTEVPAILGGRGGALIRRVVELVQAIEAADGQTGPATFTVGVLAAQLADPSVTVAVHDAVCAALAVLHSAGWRVQELTSPWLDELGAWEDALAVIVAREAHLVHRHRDQSRYAQGTKALLAFGASVSEDRYAHALKRRAELTAAIEASLTGVDVLAGPTVGYQAPEQDPPFGVGDDNAEGRFTGPYNLTGHPAVSLPMSSAGLPAGLQLAGRRGADVALLRVAAAAEHLIARPAGPAAQP